MRPSIKHRATKYRSVEKNINIPGSREQRRKETRIQVKAQKIKQQEQLMEILKFDKDNYDSELVTKSIAYWETEFNCFKDTVIGQLNDGLGDIRGKLHNTFSPFDNVLGDVYIDDLINDNPLFMHDACRLWIAEVNVKYLHKMRESNEDGYFHPKLGLWIKN